MTPPLKTSLGIRDSRGRHQFHLLELEPLLLQFPQTKLLPKPALLSYSKNHGNLFASLQIRPSLLPFLWRTLAIVSTKELSPPIEPTVRPRVFSEIGPGHLQFLDRVAQQRGYRRYRDAEGFHPSAKLALRDMIRAAREDGIFLSPLSMYRSYDEQVGQFFSAGHRRHKPIRTLWHPAHETEAWDAYLGRAERSAPPSYSKHHTGLVVDLNSVKEDYWESRTGKRTFAWLQKNAETFGYVLSYPGEDGSGADYEKWEWQYVGNSEQEYPEVAIEDYLLPFLNQE